MPEVATRQNGAKDLPLRAVVLYAGFTAAIGLRVALGGHDIAQSASAGLVFAASLVSLGVVTVRPHFIASWRTVLTGLLGGLFLLLPAIILWAWIGNAHPPLGNYPWWASVVTLVALAEEYFLRGVCYEVISSWKGELTAIIVTALAFAALHVPLYGWQAAPLDLAVGLWFGALRMASGTWLAPGIAHTLADLAAWFLR